MSNGIVYKVGYSSKLDLRRLLSYKKNTNYLSIIQCNDALKCEEEIKQKFKKHFILHAGNEYFKGNKKDMLFMFNTIVNNHIYNYNEVISNHNTDINNSKDEHKNGHEIVNNSKDEHKNDNKNDNKNNSKDEHRNGHEIVNNEKKKVNISQYNIEDVKCRFCNKIYSTTFNRNKHEKICKTKKINIEKIEKIEKTEKTEKTLKIMELEKDVIFYRDLIGAIVKK